MQFNRRSIALLISLGAGIIGIAVFFIVSGIGIAALAIICIAAAVLLINLLLRSFGNFTSGKIAAIGKFAIAGSVLLIVISVIISLAGLLLYAQDSIIFRNINDPQSRQLLHTIPGYSEIQFTAANGRTYNGMMYEQAEGISPLVIYFGGNGECSYSNMQLRRTRNQWQYFSGYNYLFIDYDGYGINGGSLDYKKLYEQALAVYDYAVTLPNVDRSRIVAMGYSLGTGAAVYLAAHRQVSGLILGAPYSNGYDLYNNLMPIFYGPLRLLVKQKLSSDLYAPEVTCPVLIFASHTDELVPFNSSVKLSKLFPGHTDFVTLDSVSHNSIFLASGVLPRVQSFLEELNQK